MSREGRKRWSLFEVFVIGRQDNPLMKRVRLVQTPLGGIYLHFIYREDLDPVPHDHPWEFWRIVLRGAYVEHFFDWPASGRWVARVQRRWRIGRFRTDQAHRIVGVEPGTVSLVVTGPKKRVWGFWCPKELLLLAARQDVYGQLMAQGMTWVDYRDALSLRPYEEVTP